MALYILGPDSTNTCCDCSARPAPCDNCSTASGCCRLVYQGAPTVLTGCYELYSISGTSSILNGGSLSFSDSGPVDTFATGEITLSRTITATVGTSSMGDYAAAGSVPAWRVAISTDGNFTINGAGSVYGHDCSPLEVKIYEMGAGCSINGTPVETFQFDQSPCVLSVPYVFNGSHVSSLPAGSYLIYFLVGGGGGFAYSENGAGCYPTSCNMSISVNISIVGNNLIPLPYLGPTPPSPVGCNKLLLPILTESSDEWFASRTAAQTKITNQTSNCVGYVNTTPFTSFTATSTASSLTLNCVANAILTSNYGRAHVLYGSLNLKEASTLSALFTASNSAGGQPITITLSIFDSDGVLVNTQNTTYSSPTTLTYTIPSDGKYIVAAISSSVGSVVPFVATLDTVFTSSDTLSVNTVQALYDIGLDCPARLDC